MAFPSHLLTLAIFLLGSLALLPTPASSNPLDDLMKPSNMFKDALEKCTKFDWGPNQAVVGPFMEALTANMTMLFDNPGDMTADQVQAMRENLETAGPMIDMFMPMCPTPNPMEELKKSLPPLIAALKTFETCLRAKDKISGLGKSFGSALG